MHKQANAKSWLQTVDFNITANADLGPRNKW